MDIQKPVTIADIVQNSDSTPYGVPPELREQLNKGHAKALEEFNAQFSQLDTSNQQPGNEPQPGQVKEETNEPKTETISKAELAKLRKAEQEARTQSGRVSQLSRELKELRENGGTLAEMKLLMAQIKEQVASRQGEPMSQINPEDEALRKLAEETDIHPAALEAIKKSHDQTKALTARLAKLEQTYNQDKELTQKEREQSKTSTYQRETSSYAHLDDDPAFQEWATQAVDFSGYSAAAWLNEHKKNLNPEAAKRIYESFNTHIQGQVKVDEGRPEPKPILPPKGKAGPVLKNEDDKKGWITRAEINEHDRKYRTNNTYIVSKEAATMSKRIMAAMRSGEIIE